MDTVLTISEIILFLSVSILCIYLISAIGKIKESISNLEKSVNDFKIKLEPGINNFNLLTEKANKVVESISRQMDVSRSILHTFKMVADDVLDLEKRIKDAIERPVLDFLNIFMGIVSGLKTVSGFLKKNKEE